MTLSISRSFVAAVLAASVLLSGCGGADARDAPRVVAETVRDTALLSASAVAIAGFGIARAELTPWQERWRVPARLSLDPRATETLGAISEGRVTRVVVMPGDRVRRGQVLVAIHSHEMMDARQAERTSTASVTRAESDLALASDARARAERLYAAKALSLAELERARAATVSALTMRDAALAERDRARAMVDHLAGPGPVPAGADEHEVLVRSPMDGIVMSREASVGSVVLVGAPLVTVSRTRSLVLHMQMPERAMAGARVGAPVRFELTAAPGGAAFTATIDRIAPMLDTLTRTVAVTATVTDTSSVLRAEMFATAEVAGPAGPAVLVVPSDAIQELDGDTIVVTAAPRGEGLELEPVRVRVGRRTARTSEIVAGLEPGAEVVVHGAATAKAEIRRRRELRAGGTP